jgi:pimeloyl-ACP methyl ester carboxylesterase
MSSSTIHLRHPESPPSSLEPVRVRNTYILFFISGNPGLIQYYCTFLCHLYALLSCNVSGQASAGEDRFQVVGRDLLGFEVDGANRIGASPPHGLQAQIEATEKALESLVDEETGSPQVILIGHSVGAYILLEVLRRHREKARVEAARGGLRIFGGICLFPTVTHIAESQSGKQFGVCTILSACVCSEPYPSWNRNLVAIISQLHVVPSVPSTLCTRGEPRCEAAARPLT